jgi:hypothetical protein
MFLLSSITLCLGLAQGVPATRPVKDLVKVPVADATAFRRLQLLLDDVDDHHDVATDGIATVYASDAEQELLRAAAIPFTVEIEDLQSYYSARAASELEQGGARLAVGSMGGFRTLAEIESEMDRLAATFPGHCSPKFSIGTTVEGRDIWALRISTTPTVHDPAKAVAWYDALHHAREPMSGESLLMFADELLSSYGSDAVATRLIETRNLLFVPCANPDGYEYNRQVAPGGGGMWRKNRRHNFDGSFGVDLNRNYDWEWGSQWPGSSGTPSSDVYRGTAPFSEPETAALATLMATMPPGMSMSAHTYSDLMLYPWGYDTVVTADDALYRSFAASFTARSGWPFGTIWQVLYIANGGSVDYHYGAFGTIAFTPEIGSSSDGFWPLPSRIDALYESIQPAYLQAGMATGAWAQVGDLLWSEISGDGDAWQEPGESWALQVSLENPGLELLDVALDLSSSSAFLSVAGSGSSMLLAPGASGMSNAFTVDISAAAPTAVPLDLDLQLDFDSWLDHTPVEIVLSRRRVLIRDRMEVDDFGWTSSNQTNWSWERAVPQLTTSNGSTVQPGADHSGSGSLCWVTGAAAGGSVGSNDVDGTAILTSPRFSLAGVPNARLHTARWFANRPGSGLDDRWVTQLSNDDGGTWVELENAGDSGSAWTEAATDLDGVLSFTAAMRLRFIVADDPNNDITEGLLDDLEISTLSGSPTLGYWGGTGTGQTARLILDGDPGADFDLAWSLTLNGGTTYPGVAGTLYLAAAQVFLGGTCGADGVALEDLNVPASISGRTLHFQGLVGRGTPQAEFTSVLDVTFP